MTPRLHRQARPHIDTTDIDKKKPSAPETPKPKRTRSPEPDSPEALKNLRKPKKQGKQDQDPKPEAEEVNPLCVSLIHVALLFPDNARFYDTNLDPETRRYNFCGTQPCPHRTKNPGPVGNDRPPETDIWAFTQELKEQYIDKEIVPDSAELATIKQYLFNLPPPPPKPSAPQPQAQSAPTPMTTPAATTTSKEIRISGPKEFSGKRSEYDAFVNAIDLYLEINSDTYDDDKKKIIFLLSYLKGGEAEIWKQQWLNGKRNTAGAIPWSTLKYEDIVGDFRQAFEPVEQASNAFFNLQTVRQGSRPVEEYITEINLLFSKAEIKDNNIKMNMFINGLTPKLAEKLLTLTPTITKYSDLVSKAITMDGNFRRSRLIVDRIRGRNSNSQQQQSKRWNFSKPQHDPNAMDIDAMSTEERQPLIKNGSCFYCKKQGHISRECPEKKK